MFYQLLRPYTDGLETINFKRGDYIYRQGETPGQLYLVDSGIIGLFHLSEGGKETFLRVFGPDQIFGHRSYFAGTKYHANTVALTDIQISIMPKDECNRICSEQPELLLEMTRLMAKSLGESELRLAGLLDKSARTRIVEGLIYFKLKYPKHIWTRKEIADFAGSTYESVTRAMSLLSENKLIIKQGRDFHIPDIQKLLDFAEEEFQS
jgi:CRP-like cAMP-binding protein